MGGGQVFSLPRLTSALAPAHWQMKRRPPVSPPPHPELAARLLSTGVPYEHICKIYYFNQLVSWTAQAGQCDPMLVIAGLLPAVTSLIGTSARLVPTVDSMDAYQSMHSVTGLHMLYVCGSQVRGS